MSASDVELDRRSFLKAGAATAGGLLVGFHLPETRSKLASRRHGCQAERLRPRRPDDAVTLIIHSAEMGQGTVTSLSSCWPKSWSATGTNPHRISRPSTPNSGRCRAWSAA